MKKQFFTLLFISLVYACSQPAKNDADEIRKVETSLIAPVYFEGDSAWTIDERMDHYGVPGVSIAVIKDYEIAWARTYGVMDKESKEPVTAQTLFQAGSISKPVAAYAALKMVELKKLDLDENVNNYLRSWKLPENEFTKETKVALKHLLSHTGGVTVHGFLGYSPDLPVPTLIQVLNGAAPANSAPILVDKFPEKDFRYAGGGYCIMQQMMIDVEDKPFPEIMDEYVLQPLEMKNSTYNNPLEETQLKFASTGYRPDGSMTKGKRHTYPEMAAAGLWTTAEDLAKFAISLQKTLKAEDNTVISESMAKKMLTPFVENFIGLGIFIDKRKNDLYFGHGGWDEGFSSNLVAHRDKGYGVVVLTNSNHPAFIDELIRSVALTYQWDNYVPVHKRMNLDLPALSDISGRYQIGKDGLVRVYIEGNRLFMKYVRGDRPSQLFRITDSTYISSDDDHVIQFKTNPADGKLNMVSINSDGSPMEFNRPKMKEDENIPYESLLEDDFNEALERYRVLQKEYPEDRAVNESNLNSQGYNLMNSGKLKLSLAVFRINTLLYPNSSNVYDSYAEACLKNGDKDLAIANYKRSLQLDPKNKNAESKLAELK